jgi:TonB family protein
MSPRVTFIFLLATSFAFGATAARPSLARLSKFAIRDPRPAIEGSINVSVALLDLGKTQVAARVSERLTKLLPASGAGDGLTLSVLDRDLSGAAARGVGYNGSLNLTLAQARNLGAAIGCDFLITGDAQTVRRSSSARPVYYESYATVFVVSARTGRLVLWDRPAAEADKPEQAETSLLKSLDASKVARYAASIADARAGEERERLERAAYDGADAIIDLSTDEGAAEHKDLREPAPYNRLRPVYTEAASRAEAEATVDALADIGADGTVTRVEIVRWAGFGLDESVSTTIRRMHFRPAARDGEAVPVRVLLRYNFRKPSKD